MKYLTLFLALLLTSCGQYIRLTIPAGEAVDLDYPGYTRYSIEMKNRSSEEVEVRVKARTTGDFISGFGLASRGEATVSVNDAGILELRNPSSKDVRVSLSAPRRQDVTKSLDGPGTIGFTLRNSSLKSIPLLIPGVMNPNLSPMSNSGVDLAPGQEIFFKVRSKKYLLLTVDETIEPGETIDVPKLIEQRKAQLGI